MVQKSFIEFQKISKIIFLKNNNNVRQSNSVSENIF